MFLACIAISAEAGDLGRATDTGLASIGSNDGLQVATRNVESEYPTGIAVISYSSDSENFYFWLDEFDWNSVDSICATHEKFGIRVEPANAPLIDQAKMAFLSGKQVKVTWNTGACTGGGVRPYYIKIYR